MDDPCRWLIGREAERANVLSSEVLAVGIIGARIARFQTRGMARVGCDGARDGVGRRDRRDTPGSC